MRSIHSSEGGWDESERCRAAVSGIGCSVKRAREMKIFLLRPTPYSNHVEDAARGPGPARDPILSGPRDVPKS